MLGTVGEGHFEGTLSRRIDGLEILQLGHPALSMALAHVGLAPLTGKGALRPIVSVARTVVARVRLLALPDTALRIGCRIVVGVGLRLIGRGIEPLQGVRRLVPYHILPRTAVFLQIGLGEQLGLHHGGPMEDMGDRRSGGFLVIHHEEAGVGPAFHELPIDQVVLDDDVTHGQCERRIGAPL